MEVNKVYLGDCLPILRKMKDKSIDLVVTDPPFGIGINKMNFVMSGAIKVGGAYRNDYSKHPTDWDEKGLTQEYFNEMKRVSKNQIIFGANHFANILPNSRCWIVWDKRIEEKYNNDFADAELVWTSFDKPTRIIRFLWSGMLQGNMKTKEKRVHPTQKPVVVMRKIIEMFSTKGETILDCFCGSGSTLLAAKQTGRNYIGIEKEKLYFDITLERLKQKTLW
jgi:site-specific DNA-methyltransferase (adenine-specific)